MQCLEVSVAVRPIYGSLGVKRLKKLIHPSFDHRKYIRLSTIRTPISHVHHYYATFLCTFKILISTIFWNTVFLRRQRPRFTLCEAGNWDRTYRVLDFLLKIKGTAVAQWLRCCATNRRVSGSISDGVIGIFHCHSPSDRTMALRSTQPLTEMSTRSISWG